MDLFDIVNQEKTAQAAPLAARMRPKGLDEFIGQEEVVGPGRMLRRAIEADRLSSVILYGPPGTGKTTLAQVIAENTKAHFETLNAVTSGVADIKRVIAEAKDRRRMHMRATVLFIDEIHRFNKSQQDALLPAVEDGTLTLIGATTANPYFDVNSALLSRSRVVRLRSLSPDALRKIIHNALNDRDKGLGRFAVKISEEAVDHFVVSAHGDARVALNALELAVLTTPPDPNGVITVDLGVAEESVQQKIVRYDKDGDQHYDVVSAFIKSMRGSDPDAALHWLAKMLQAGEQPRFIARRMVICASEDVGNADPTALLVAMAAAQAVELLGLPEAQINLAHAATYIASAPKSNASYVGLARAQEDLRSQDCGEVPSHLRDSHYPGAAKLGHGKGYEYAHDHPEHFVRQQYLPDALVGKRYYEPTSNGREQEIRRRLEHLWGRTNADRV